MRANRFGRPWTPAVVSKKEQVRGAAKSALRTETDDDTYDDEESPLPSEDEPQELNFEE